MSYTNKYLPGVVLQTPQAVAAYIAANPGDERARWWRIVPAPGNALGLTTDDIPEGVSNLYYNPSRVSAEIAEAVAGVEVPEPSDDLPQALGAAAAGVADEYSRGDHVHPLPAGVFIPLSQKGTASGVAELDSGGRIPSGQLPSYVDDVLEYSDYSLFPATGEAGKIYLATGGVQANKTFRWSGSVYVEISASLALGGLSSTAHRGDHGVAAYSHSQATGNPHGTTAADVGAAPATHTHRSTDIRTGTDAVVGGILVASTDDPDQPFIYAIAPRYGQLDGGPWRFVGAGWQEMPALSDSDVRLGDWTAGKITNARVDDGAAIAWNKISKTGANAGDVGALPDLDLTGDIDFNNLNGGAPGRYSVNGSSYVHAPSGAAPGVGYDVWQGTGSAGLLTQLVFDGVYGGIAYRWEFSVGVWTPWIYPWDDLSLPVAPFMKTVLDDANAPAARATLGAAASAGVTNGSDAASGVVGQYYETSLPNLPEASMVYAVNGSPVEVLSLSLPAGDWLVEGQATAHITGAMNGNKVVSGLNTSIAIPTDGTEIYGGLQVFSATNGFQTMTGSKRFSLTTTTTVHLVAQIDFSAGTPALFGCMSARRMR